MKFLIVLSMFGLTAGVRRTASVYISGLPISERAIILDGKAYLPVRDVAENLHANVDYDNKQRRITITRRTRPLLLDLMLFATRHDRPVTDIIMPSRADQIVRLITIYANKNVEDAGAIIAEADTWRNDRFSVWQSTWLARRLESAMLTDEVEFNHTMIGVLEELLRHSLILSLWYERE